MIKRYFQTIKHTCYKCNKTSTVANVYEAEHKNSAIYRYAPYEFSQKEKQLVKQHGIILNEQNVFCCPHCNAPLDMHNIMDNFVLIDQMEDKKLKSYNVKTKQIATNLKNLRAERQKFPECSEMNRNYLLLLILVRISKHSCQIQSFWLLFVRRTLRIPDG